jgi:hypothetical protein
MLYRNGETIYPCIDFQQENILLKSYKYDWLEKVADAGFSTITFTAFGGDSPVNILTASDATRADWRRFVENANSKGIIPFVYASEMENVLTTTQRLAICVRIEETFRGLEIIVVIGEEFRGDTRTALEVGRWLRRNTDWLIATHAPVGADYPRWVESSMMMIHDGCLDVVLLQCYVDEMATKALIWQDKPVAVIAHEQRPYWSGTTTTSYEWALRAKRLDLAGFSIYTGYNNVCNDLDCPDPSVYADYLTEVTNAFQFLTPDAEFWTIDVNRDGVIDVADWMFR